MRDFGRGGKKNKRREGGTLDRSSGLHRCVINIVLVTYYITVQKLFDYFSTCPIMMAVIFF